MTPCDPVGTQTLQWECLRSASSSIEAGEGGERTVSPRGPGNGMHTGDPALRGGEAATGLSAGISAHASFQEQHHQQKTSGAILASLLEVRTVDQFPGWNYMDFSPASHKALPQRLPCGPVVCPLLLRLVSGRPGHQDAGRNFITFPSNPHAHFCPYGFLVWVFFFFNDDFPFV